MCLLILMCDMNSLSTWRNTKQSIAQMISIRVEVQMCLNEVSFNECTKTTKDSSIVVYKNAHFFSTVCTISTFSPNCLIT